METRTSGTVDPTQRTEVLNISSTTNGTTVLLLTAIAFLAVLTVPAVADHAGLDATGVDATPGAAAINEVCTPFRLDHSPNQHFLCVGLEIQK